MLAVYRRHLKGCPHRVEGRKHRKCQCPIWVDGYIAGERVGKSLKTKNWQKAQDTVREWEADNKVSEQEQAVPVSVERAWEKFIADAKARDLREPTIYKYDLLNREMVRFAEEKGIRYLKEFDIDTLRDFRAAWVNRNLAALKKLERLRAFFNFAFDSGWVEHNWAKKLKNPKIDSLPTMPFTREEMARILAACLRYRDRYRKAGQAYAWKLYALVLLLRHSGLRIRDAVTLTKAMLSDSRLFLYTAKTGTPVFCPLPDSVIQALAKCSTTDQTLFFWSGEGKPKSAVGDWQRTLKRLFELAEVPGGHAHRFRDTFAVELLLTGTPLEVVSVLLGHQSLRITEKHYAPWVKARQEQLEASVKRSWEADAAGTYATPALHGKAALVN